MENNKKIWFTLTGTGFRHGKEFLVPGLVIRLVRDPENEHDSEAIRAELPGLGHIGYVANSVNTRIGESSSAGFLCSMISEEGRGIVRYNVDRGVVCELDTEEHNMPLEPGTVIS